ncbi:MAG: hypothetical protein K9L87_03280 [Candidatus Omnitrophica bacterium]|nr:hypothetical protein [Candidatus Omnitrophota bacterium]MCF7909783.1 hypothetical protein [Candidatus Omnitrophota bacterium]
MKHLFLSLLTLFLLINPLIAEDKLSLVSEENLREEYIIGDYTVKIYRDYPTGEGLLHIFKDDELVYSEKNWKFRIGHVYKQLDEISSIEIGQDITGDGESDLIVSHWSGGAHCCYSFYVFSLGEKFRFIDKIEAKDSDLAKFKDINNDGIFEFAAADWNFAYWHECFAGSPAPRVILSYIDGKYKLAMDLMKKPLPSPKKEKAIIEAIQTSDRWLSKGDFWCKELETCPPSDTWGYMLELIYTGHPEEAWNFYDKIWLEDKPGKEEFLAEFKEVLAESPYWDSLKNIQGMK